MSDPITWLGLDLGTQSVRAVAVSASGDMLAGASRPLTSHRDGARHEQDPGEWWDALATACREALAGLKRRPIGGLAVCGTSGTVLLVDSAGEPVSRGLMYRMQPAWALPKLLWLLREHGERGHGARLAHQVDFVTRRLVGHEVPAEQPRAEDRLRPAPLRLATRRDDRDWRPRRDAARRRALRDPAGSGGSRRGWLDPGVAGHARARAA